MLKGQYDMVLLDLPPVIVEMDTIVLSANIFLEGTVQPDHAVGCATGERVGELCRDWGDSGMQ